MIGNADQDAFINKNKWGVVTTLRKDGSPTSSVIFFARDGDELLFSTTEDRLKTKTVDNDPRMSLCVLDDGAPYGYVTVEGTATVQRNDVVEAHKKIVSAMRGEDFEPPEGYAERLERERRLVIRLKAERVSGVVNRP
jgi:PPOX class probable F420-dependent enzyme